MKITLALGGGAGLGWAHIGVLRALDEAGIEIGAIAGTSIGGVAAIAYASGRLETLETLAHSVSTMRQVLRYLGPNWKPGSLLSGKGVARLIEQHLADLTFEDLAIPTVVVAADLVSGKPVVLDRGSVGDAIHATIAIPGVFYPVLREGCILIDGGMIMPVPVRAARAIAPKLPLLAINLQGDYHGRARAAGIERPRLTTFAVVRAATGLMMSQLARQSLDIDPPDLELPLPIGHIDTTNFTRAEELIRIGGEAVRQALPRIRALAACSYDRR